MAPILLSGLAIFFSFTIEAVTGFGCTVIALPFVTALLGMQEGIIEVTILAFLLALWIAAKNFRDIRFRTLLTIVLLMLPGLVLGQYIQNIADLSILKTLLAAFITAVSALRLGAMAIRHFRARDGQQAEREPKVRWYGYIALIAAGVVHGLFSSGGPLAIIYTSVALPDKRSFRATLCALWTVLNTFLVVSYVAGGRITSAMGGQMLCLLPFMVAGIVVGELLHHKVNDKIFLALVYVVLLATGIVMFI
ncbi:MAG: sulfite exporter TauE/SafE family protein [Spirochaetales bacterium]|nr:sulfite exporter TauE/SafE family protein [Spirochaetales bacterium]